MLGDGWWLLEDFGEVVYTIYKSVDMKIAYVMESLAIMGGVERIMVSKMNSLADSYGHDVTLIEVYDYEGAPDRYALSDNVGRIRLGIRKTRHGWMKPWQMLHVVRSVMKAVDSLRPDVMSCSALLGVIVYGLGTYGCRRIYESHGPRRYMMMPWLVRRMERRVDMVVCLTQGDASEYAIARNVCVIPNFIDDSFFLPKKECRHTHATALGRMEEEKGFDLLIRAWKKVTERLPDALLSIYGDGRMHDDLEALVNSLELGNNIVLLPPSADTRQIYADSSIVVVPSRFEGFSLVTVEAMAQGVPVVACDVEYGPREILAEGRGGLLVQRTEDDIADAIVCLLTDEALHNKLSAEGREVASRYARDVVMKQWERLIE